VLWCDEAKEEACNFGEDAVVHQYRNCGLPGDQLHHELARAEAKAELVEETVQDSALRLEPVPRVHQQWHVRAGRVLLLCCYRLWRVSVGGGKQLLSRVELECPLVAKRLDRIDVGKVRRRQRRPQRKHWLPGFAGNGAPLLLAPLSDSSLLSVAVSLACEDRSCVGVVLVIETYVVRQLHP